MLTSFYESYLLLVGLCAFFCVLVNFYNLMRYLSQPLRQQRQAERVEEFVDMFSDYVNFYDKLGKKYKKLEKKHKEKASILNRRDRRLYRTVRRKIKRQTQLRALDSAMESMNWRKPKDISQELCRLLNMALSDNLYRFKGMDDAVRALTVTLGMRTGIDSPRFQDFLLECLKSKTMYLRIAVLRAYSAQGSQPLMMSALAMVRSQGDVYSPKLLTDVLMAYQGERTRLLETMWHELDGYPVNLGCALINLLTMEKQKDFAARILALMEDENRHKELRIAAIKYFGAVYYPAAEAPLGTFLDESEWEYAAVAAGALQNYDCAACGHKLLNALSSRNWHVRLNSAMTLVERCPQLVDEALHSSDRYARDIMQYALNVKGGRVA